MKQLTVRVHHSAGLHARPAAEFVQTAMAYESEIQLAYKGRTANAKSILGVLGLGVTAEAVVELIVNGPDESGAADALMACLAHESETTGTGTSAPGADVGEGEGSGR